MGLHRTPYGTFFVQRCLHTGQVLQVLPVVKPEMPSHLPSVQELGLTAEFIARRRKRLDDDCGKAATERQRLRDELDRAGGGQLLATGKAVLAQRGDGGDGPSEHAPPPAAATAAAASHQGEFVRRFVHEVFTQTHAGGAAGDDAAAAAAALGTAVQGPPLPVAGFAAPDSALSPQTDSTSLAADVVLAHKHRKRARPNKGKGRAQ